MLKKKGENTMKKSNVDIAKMVAARGYDFDEVLEGLDIGRTPAEEEQEITQEEFDDLIENICLYHMIVEENRRSRLLWGDEYSGRVIHTVR